MYNFNLLDSIEDIKNEFDFLLSEYNFKIAEEKFTNKGVTYLYSKGEIRVNLNYDYRENFFYFKIIRGGDTQYPNDQDFENIKPFFHLAQKYEPGFNPDRLQPDNNQYKEALRLNAEILRKYGSKILKGVGWI